MIEIEQRGQAGSAPLGVVFSTSMNRPDAAFALAAIYLAAIKRECRVGSVCVTGSGLNAAIFCDVLDRFYNGAPKNGNQALPPGLLATTPPAPDSPMVTAPVERKKDTGEAQYVRTLRKVTDTSQAEAVLRNGVIFNAESVMVLSGPAGPLAQSLNLLDVPAIYQKRVKRLVIVDAGVPQKDVAALRRIVAEWPTPIFFVGRDVGEALKFPGAKLEELFAPSPAHPLVDAYNAFKPAPYDAPLYDVAAVHYAIHPDSGFFASSEPGSLKVGDDGGVQFVAGGGKIQRLSVDPAKQADALAALIALVTQKPPAAPGARGRGAGAA
ncbi:MAG: hypothetical protein ABI051_13650 [Vicinamibacterales bacterium]